MDQGASQLGQEIGEEILRQGITLSTVVRGWSMYPFLRHGDLIEVKASEAGEIRVGDVLMFRQGDGLWVVHRVVQILGRDKCPVFKTKGDAVLVADPPVSPEQILGRVSAIQRGTRRLDMEARWWRLVNRALAAMRRTPRLPWCIARLARRATIRYRPDAPADCQTHNTTVRSRSSHMGGTR